MSSLTRITPLKVMFAGLFSLVLTMGVARFSYTPLLPVMLDQTFLTDSSGGWLATINYMGYICGALIASFLTNLKVKDTLYRIGLIAAVLSTVGMALAENYILWSVMRFFAGLSSAAGLLIGSGLILNWMIRHDKKPQLGIHFAGAGLGIALSAAVALAVADRFDWVEQWQLFALVGILLAIPAWAWLPRASNTHVTEAGEKLEDRSPRKKWMLMLYLAYFCAGVGYVVTATFLVTIIDSQAALQGKGNIVWLVTGLAAAPACLVWDKIALRIGELNALILAYGINIIGIIIPAFVSSFAGLLFSGIVFGATFIGIVSLMLTMVGKFFPTTPAKPMARLTISYGIAQIVAPAVSGNVAEITGNYHSPLMMASVLMLVGVGLLLTLRTIRQYDE